MVDQSSNMTEAAGAGECYNTYCKNTKSSDGAQLLNCAGCKKARYCSKDCQKQHWTDHKLYCKHVASGGTSSASFDVLKYYEKIAVHDPEAQALARNINLMLPGPGVEPHGLQKPIRRLIAKGQDTPSNLALFFGRGPAQSGGQEITQSHANNRLEVLLRAPPGSPDYVMAAGLGLDDGCPQSEWTPREPSAAEARRVGEIRDVQEAIRTHMGARGVADVGGADMREVLLKSFGDRWADGMQVYQLAINAMDQGVSVGGR